MVNIYIVRHGQTYFNLFKRFQGWSDIELTNKGYQDAHEAGKRFKNLPLDAVYSSDLKRAIDTANLILNENQKSEELTLKPLKELREEFFGSFEGLPSRVVVDSLDSEIEGDKKYDQLFQKYGSDKLMDLMAEGDPYSLAENSSQFWSRIDKGFQIIKEENPDAKNILIVAHGTLIRALASRFGKEEWAGQSVKNGSASILTGDFPEIEMVTFNDKTNQW